MVQFTAAVATDNSNLTELDLFSHLGGLKFSHTSGHGFWATSGDVKMVVGGSTFLYNIFNHRPFYGQIQSVLVQDSGVNQYKLSDMFVTVSNINKLTKPVQLFSGNDKLNGSTGADSLFGYAGNDTISGNNGPDKLNGGAGNDAISGGAGPDTYTGGSGSDNFIFNAAINANDRITDFREPDQVQLARKVFEGVGPLGFLDPDAFHVGSTITDPDQRIIYDRNALPNAGYLYFSEDGTSMVRFAIVNSGPAMTAHDFLIV